MTAHERSCVDLIEGGGASTRQFARDPQLRRALGWSWPAHDARIHGLVLRSPERGAQDDVACYQRWRTAIERALPAVENSPRAARRVVFGVESAASAGSWCALWARACCAIEPPVSFSAVSDLTAAAACSSALMKVSSSRARRTDFASFGGGRSVAEQVVRTLENIPQIGPKAARALLREHRSLANIATTSASSLGRALGSVRKGIAVHAWLHAPGPAADSGAGTARGGSGGAVSTDVATLAALPPRPSLTWCVPGRAVRVEYDGKLYDATVECVTEGDATSQTRELKVRYVSDGSFERIPWAEVAERVTHRSPVPTPSPQLRAAAPPDVSMVVSESSSDDGDAMEEDETAAVDESGHSVQRSVVVPESPSTSEAEAAAGEDVSWRDAVDDYDWDDDEY